jgi:hypothetical protein
MHAWPTSDEVRTAAGQISGYVTYPSGHLDATAEIDVGPAVLVVDGLPPLLDVDRPGGGSEDDAAHGAGLLAGSQDAYHPFHRRLDYLVLQLETIYVCIYAGACNGVR